MGSMNQEHIIDHNTGQNHGRDCWEKKSSTNIVFVITLVGGTFKPEIRYGSLTCPVLFADDDETSVSQGSSMEDPG